MTTALAPILGMKRALDATFDALSGKPEQIEMTSTRPSMKEIEDAADEARNEAQDREAWLDQRELDMTGQIEDLTAEIDTLKLRVAAADALIKKLSAERDNLQVHVRLLRAKCEVFLQNVCLYVGDALDWIRDQKS